MGHTGTSWAPFCALLALFGVIPVSFFTCFIVLLYLQVRFSDKVDQFPQKKTRFPFLAKTGSENSDSVRYCHQNPEIKGTLKKRRFGSLLGTPFGPLWEPFWAPFGASWALLGPLGALLALLWFPFGLLLAPLGSHNLVLG